MADRVILCVTSDGCTCGAPASTPSGMHHDHCPVNPGEPDDIGCRVCNIPPCIPPVVPVTTEPTA